MANIANGEIFLTSEEFDALYGGEPIPELSLDLPVWDKGGPSDAVMRWHEAGLITGHVLDAGCGTGSNSIWVAEQGHPVTGFDASPNAVQIASSHAPAGLPVNFTVADATDLQLPAAYDTVIDSALYHCLSTEERRRYLDGLHRIGQPGARLLMICISDAMARTLPGPGRITSDELHETLPAAGWAITDLATGVIPVGYTLDALRQVCAAADLPEPSGDEVAFVDGLAQFPVWEVVAERQDVQH